MTSKKEKLKNKTSLVFGAAGSIGSALCKRLQTETDELVLVDQDETGLFDLAEELGEKKVKYFIANIQDREGVFSLIEEYRPDYVYFVSAYKHVFMMEQMPAVAWNNNVYGLLNAVDASIANGAKKFIFISSDKAVNPSTVMGRTKLIGEHICARAQKESKTKFIIVRFGNVLGSRGSVVPIFQKLINENKNLTVTSPKMKRYFLGIYDAVDLVIKAGNIGKGGETFILDMGKEVLISELARMMIKLSGKDLKIEYTKPKVGEKYREQLFTKEEKKRLEKLNGMYVIRNKV